jgi:hypothetical protein
MPSASSKPSNAAHDVEVGHEVVMKRRCQHERVMPATTIDARRGLIAHPAFRIGRAFAGSIARSQAPRGQMFDKRDLGRVFELYDHQLVASTPPRRLRYLWVR